MRDIAALNDVTDVTKALISPIHANDYVFQHFGGSQKCISDITSFLKPIKTVYQEP
jgi:hypothetical protein